MKYLYFSYVSLKKRLVYKFDLIFSYLLVFISGIACKFFWEALANAGKIQAKEAKMYITYTVLTAILATIFTSDLITNMGEKVRSGQIVSDLQKPVDFQMMSIADSFGGMLGSLILDFIPKLLVMKIIIDIYLPPSLLHTVLFLASCLLGYLILVCIDYLISLLAFYFVEVWAFWVIKGIIIGFCSGQYLPLWLYPEKLVRVLDYLPFKHLYYVPVNIYLSNVSIKEAVYSLILQLCWLAALFILGKLLTALSIRKLTIAGG